MSKERCKSTHPKKGIQCGQPLGHAGRHGNGTQISNWDDPQSTLLTGAIKPSAPLTPEEREMLYGEA
jgi:hypothetical protein